MATICLALVVLSFAQSTGNTAADTKIDLVTDPGRFLAKALKLWDPSGNAGQLQNQAYGYLFPVGPFFLLCHWTGLQPWAAQRLWASTLLVLAFLGMVWLARLLGVTGFWAPVAAGLVYALAPQVLAELFSISAGLTPTVALPWVLLPLVRGAERGSVRRAAALSGLALLFAGGTNAAATLAILPAPALWLLTRQRGPRRAGLIRNWVLAVLLASAWWTIPLLLFGSYSPPFLNWIEAAQNTTASTSLSANLRGVEHWESYLGPGVWPAGWILVRPAAAILATTAVAAAGLAGLAHRRQPNRLFLISCLGVGLALLSIGHLAPVTGPFAAQLQAALDGPLVAFRNIHKFDPLIRLPVAIGVGALLARIRPPWWHSFDVGSGQSIQLPIRPLVAVLAAAIALVTISPALGNRLVPQPRAETMPAWWQQAGAWLDANSHDVRTLVVPGATTPTYFWGSTVDDALQPETDAPWVVRSSIPLAPAGTIRLLDAIDGRLATGHRDDALASLMNRSGIGFVLVRNDLDTTASLATPYNIVRTTLLHSPGFSRVAGFGPELGGGTSASRLVDGGAGVPRPAVEIFRVGDLNSPVGLLPTSAAVLATGTSDNLPQLVDRGLGVRTPVLFGPDAQILGSAAGNIRVSTDGIRRQQADFGGGTGKSGTLTANAPFDGFRAAYDYLPDPTPVLSSMAYTGIRAVTASSSGADVYAAFDASQASGPFAAVDGDPATAWHSASLTGAVGQWLQVDLSSPASPRFVSITFLPDKGVYPSQISVQAGRVSQLYPVRPTTAAQSFAVPAKSISSLRIGVRAMSDRTFGSSVAISTLSIPGVTGGRSLVVPTEPHSDLLAFDAAPGYRDGCLDVASQPSCDDALGAAGEEDSALDRRFVLSDAATYRPTASFRLLASTALNAQLDSRLAIHASASSVVSTDPRLRPGAAVDGDPATTWSAAAGDKNPTLTLDLGATRSVRSLRIATAATAATGVPQRVSVRAGAEHWQGTLSGDGLVRFDKPARTRTIVISVLSSSLRLSSSTLTGDSRLLPVGISTVSIDDGARQSAPALPPTIGVGCDAGLSMSVDGIGVAMTITARTADVLAGRAVTATACDQRQIPFAAGPHSLRLTGPAGALPRSMTLDDGSDLAATPAPAGSYSISDWTATSRRVAVATSSQSFLVIRENFNAGWSAHLGKATLRATRLDGWQQAFLLPAGTQGTVVLAYAPQRYFGAGLLLGLVAVLALLALVVLPSRRREPATLAESRWPAWTQALLLLAVAVQTAGPAGLLTGLVILAVCRLLWPAGGGMPVWIGSLAFLGAGIDIASAAPISRFTTANSSLSQLLTVSAFLLAAVVGLPAWRRRRWS